MLVFKGLWELAVKIAIAEIKGFIPFTIELIHAHL